MTDSPVNQSEDKDKCYCGHRRESHMSNGSCLGLVQGIMTMSNCPCHRFIKVS